LKRYHELPFVKEKSDKYYKEYRKTHIRIQIEKVGYQCPDCKGVDKSSRIAKPRRREYGQGNKCPYCGHIVLKKRVIFNRLTGEVCG
jgi:predicted RNA-binding Zn-ribbon protein involved in translation (DUF1610 family)